MKHIKMHIVRARNQLSPILLACKTDGKHNRIFSAISLSIGDKIVSLLLLLIELNRALFLPRHNSNPIDVYVFIFAIKRNTHNKINT